MAGAQDAPTAPLPSSTEASSAFGAATPPGPFRSRVTTMAYRTPRRIAWPSAGAHESVLVVR